MAVRNCAQLLQDGAVTSVTYAELYDQVRAFAAGLQKLGLKPKEIAQRLNIATHTVKSHVRNVMEKLALHTRLQIAAYSHREG